jgi:hypothetical protein
MIIQRFRYFLLGLILVFVFLAYLPFLDNYFVADDFAILLGAKQSGFRPAGFFSPITQHLQPLFKLLIAVEYHLFGLNAKWYNFVSLSVHLLNVFLTSLLFGSLFKNVSIGLLASLFFGISASHWRTTMWMTTQGQQLAAFWFLIAFIFFVQYLRHGGKWSAVVSIFAHLLMMLSFTSGFEVPFFYLVIYLIVKKTNRFNIKDNFKDALIVAFPYFVNVILIFALRHILLPSKAGLFESSGGIEAALANLPAGIGFVLGGAYKGLLGSFMGTYVIGSANADLWIIAGLIVMLAFTDWSPRGLRNYWTFIICFFLWVFAIYFPPTLPRIPNGYEWFISRARYLYLPCIPAAALMAIFIKSLRPFSSSGKMKFLKPLIVVGIAGVALVNFVKLRREHIHRAPQIETFQKMTVVFEKDIQRLLDSSNIDAVQVINLPFAGKTGNYAGWNVRPNQLSLLLFSETELAKVEFIPNKNHEKRNPNISLFEVVSGRGSLHMIELGADAVNDQAD